MRLPIRIPLLCCALAAVAAYSGPLVAAETAPEQIEFFESKVRPLLAENCYQCHSSQAKTLKGGLRLDSRAATIKGGDSGEAVVPGKPEASPLIHAVRWQAFEMPPDGKLRDDQIAVLVKWVEIGAPWPEEKATPPVVEAKTYDWKALREQHWAWRPIVRAEVPRVKDAAWPRNEIDRFVLAKLEAAGLEPNPPADPRVLIRRVYFDLIGLPPTPEEVEAFVSHFAPSPTRPASHSKDEGARGREGEGEKAYAALVDKLLASPHYGERWGRHWLDVARYSDGFGGFLDNSALPNAWRYRDWVVETLNADLPYDEFVRRQLAGDLIDREHAVATGFLALGPTYISDGGDPDAIAQAQSETLDDRVDTVSRGLMALTVACSRCHDHRFDPYPQLDYYSLAGVFNNTKIRDFPLASPEVVKAYDDVQKQIDELDKKAKKIKADARSEGRRVTEEEQRTVKELTAEMEEIQKKRPEKYPFAHALTDTGSSNMNLAIRGNLRRPGPAAPRRFLRIIAGDDPPLFQRGSGRLDLADAIVSPTNPLTARVMVNRVWQQHFGQGLVRTPSNFGTLGEKPSHPELLDWLSAKFMGASGTDLGWSLKRLHREIVLSATYRMDSASHERAYDVDGDNRLLWRMSPRRLDVEAWRDTLLSVTGELDTKLGGPSIPDIATSSRRTLYAAVSRNGDKFSSDSFLRMFDFPVPRATSEGRVTSIVPQQSLFLMNSPFMAQRAKALAGRLATEGTDAAARIRRAYLLLYSRPVSDEELRLGQDFLASSSTEDKSLTPWEQYAQVLLSASELMYWE